MIIVPPTKPVIANLNSYYLDVEKLIEHYQAELRSGGIHLKSIAGDGMIFFDDVTIVNVFFQDKERWMDGVAARDELIRILKVHNFSVSVYRIEPDKLHLWANLAYAEDLEGDFGTAGTTLDTLIRRMGAENLTGYIDVSISGASDRALIFFHGGSIAGLTCSWEQDGQSLTKQNLQRLILKSKTSGATYNIKHVDLNRIRRNTESTAETPPSVRATALLQELLSTLESLVVSEKRTNADFDTLLKKKFFEKADRYEFLDPFAAEIQYDNGRFGFTGNAPMNQIAKGVSECVRELADDLGLLSLLLQKLEPWKQEYQNEIISFGVEL